MAKARGKVLGVSVILWHQAFQVRLCSPTVVAIDIKSACHSGLNRKSPAKQPEVTEPPMRTPALCTTVEAQLAWRALARQAWEIARLYYEGPEKRVAWFNLAVNLFLQACMSGLFVVVSYTQVRRTEVPLLHACLPIRTILASVAVASNRSGGQRRTLCPVPFRPPFGRALSPCRGTSPPRSARRTTQRFRRLCSNFSRSSLSSARSTLSCLGTPPQQSPNPQSPSNQAPRAFCFILLLSAPFALYPIIPDDAFPLDRWQSHITIQWRVWLARHVVNLYFGAPFGAGNVPFYALQLEHPEVDNPDQRISNDVAGFVSFATGFITTVRHQRSAPPVHLCRN